MLHDPHIAGKILKKNSYFWLLKNPGCYSWHLEFEGRIPMEGAEGAAFCVVRDIRSRFTSELAVALAGTFPRDDPRDAIWVQPQGSALVRGPDEGTC
jgi:hypothetical protein